MALYGPLPGPRMAYDRDGSRLLMLPNTGQVHDMTSSAHLVNREHGAADPGIGPRGIEFPLGLLSGNPTRLFCPVVLLFPEPRDLFGYYMVTIRNTSDGITGTLRVSEDTTDGVDGAWTTLQNPFIRNISSIFSAQPPIKLGHQWREEAVSVSASNIIAVRFNMSGGNSPWLRNLHLYGEPSSDGGDRLSLRHPTLDEDVDGDHFDWAESPRGSEAVKEFRVRNHSAAFTANSVTVSAHGFTVPVVAGYHEFSANGTDFDATLDIGNLAPGVTSSVIYVRRVIPTDAPLGLRAFRILVDADSWAT